MNIDFYTQPHKEQRASLFKLALAAGEINYQDERQVKNLKDSCEDLFTLISSHASHEETFLHPFLKKRLLSTVQKLEQAHPIIENELLSLKINIDSFYKNLANNHKKDEFGLEFYRAINRFIILYFDHINHEEYFMQTIWQVSTQSELLGLMTAFMAYAMQDKAKSWLEQTLAHLSLQDKQVMFNTAKLFSPQQYYQIMCDTTSKIVGQSEWQTISQGLI